MKTFAPNRPWRHVLSIILYSMAFIAYPGCAVPWNLTLRPGATGKVVNSVTGRPIQGAVVTVGDSQDSPDIPIGRAGTLPDGSFTLPPYRRLGFNVYMEGSDGSAAFSVTKHGYRQYKSFINFDYLSQGKNSTKAVGTIPLRTSSK